jgi:hypothetical protein
LLLAGAVAGLGFGGPAARAADQFEDIVVSPGMMPSEQGQGGYVEYVITVTNRSDSTAHEVKLVLPKNRYSRRGNGIRSISRTVQVSPSATVRVRLWQPDLPLEGSDLEVFIDGKAQSRGVAITINQNRGSRNDRHRMGPHNVFILVAHNFPRDLEANVMKGLPPAGPGGGMPPAPPAEGEDALPLIRVHPMNLRWVRPETPVKDWSTNWLGYSSFTGVVLTSADLGDMPPAVRTALWQYVECGGALLVAGKANVPKSWEVVKGAPKELGVVYRGGFGECLVTSQDQPRVWTPGQWQPILALWSRKAEPLFKVRTVSEANREFPVVDKISIPVRGLFVLMIVFALAIGPVNFYVLGRMKRRIWLLWTVPAISLVTCGLVFGYMLLVEGWQGHVRAEGLTLLDEQTHRATTLGWAGVYTPLTPGDGLHFGGATELTPQLAVNFERYSQGPTTSRTIDWTRDQHLAAGWVTARVPAHFMLRKNEARRERVTVRRDGKSLTAVNGLGADVHKLWVADAAGRVYTADNIPAGGEAVLTPTEAQASGNAGTLRNLFESDWTTHFERVTKKPEAYLRPGCYVAALESAPFIEEILSGARRKARSLVYGIMKEPVHAD